MDDGEDDGALLVEKAVDHPIVGDETGIAPELGDDLACFGKSLDLAADSDDLVRDHEGVEVGVAADVVLDFRCLIRNLLVDPRGRDRRSRAGDGSEYHLPLKPLLDRPNQLPRGIFGSSDNVEISMTAREALHRIVDELPESELPVATRVLGDLRQGEKRRRADRDARDLEILNRSADALNEEVDDILAYQVEL